MSVQLLSGCTAAAHTISLLSLISLTQSWLTSDQAGLGLIWIETWYLSRHFSILSNEVTNILQPCASSSVLNYKVPRIYPTGQYYLRSIFQCRNLLELIPSALGYNFRQDSTLKRTMRLLNASTFKVSEFLDDRNVAPYAILSHAWSQQECALQDMENPDVKSMAGYPKNENCCRQAVRDGYERDWHVSSSTVTWSYAEDKF